MSYNTKTLVAQYHASGLTQRQFCTKHAVAFSTLQYHLHKSKQGAGSAPASPNFIRLTQPTGTGAPVRTVAFLRGSFSVSEIADLLQRIAS